MATETSVTSGELTTVITEMLDRIANVATLVDQVFPDKAVGLGIKDCGEKLKQHVELLSLKAAGIEILDDVDIPSSIEEVNKLVVTECLGELKLISKLRETSVPADAEYRNHCDYVLGLLHYIRK